MNGISTGVLSAINPRATSHAVRPAAPGNNAVGSIADRRRGTDQARAAAIVHTYDGASAVEFHENVGKGIHARLARGGPVGGDLAGEEDGRLALLDGVQGCGKLFLRLLAAARGGGGKEGPLLGTLRLLLDVE